MFRQCRSVLSVVWRKEFIMNNYLESSRETVRSLQTMGNADTILLHELLAVLLGVEAEPGLCGRLAKKRDGHTCRDERIGF